MHENSSPETARDPICGMDVVTADARHTAEHAGQTHYFCSAGFRTKFLEHPEAHLTEQSGEDALHEDPVCHMQVRTDSPHQEEHQGRRYYFCSAGCAEKFQKAPDHYLKPRPKPVPSGSDTRTFTCPMHPEVRQEGPGACPLCGMDLEPLEISA